MSSLNHRQHLTKRGLAAVTALTTLLSLLVGATLAPTASADSHSVEGIAYKVDDGDTLHVNVPGEGQLYIRMTGINAAELTTYKVNPDQWQGKCHAVAAAKRLYDLVHNKKVRVYARDAASTSGPRLRRAISVEINGVWTDVGGILIDEGHALFLPSTDEYEFNRDYLRRAQVAAARGIGIWNTSACGAGPSAEAPLSLSVEWDAHGDDRVNVNGEYFKITNSGDTAVPLENWWVRDSAMRGTKDHPGYRFKTGASVAARSSIVVRVGSGTDTARTKYWGLGAPVFENVTAAPKWVGDGGYLFDPQHDLRAWQMYPCNEFCPVPALAGKVAISKIVADPAGVDYAKNEYVVVKNISAGRISLVGYDLRAGTKRHVFRTGSWLDPNQQVAVYMGRGTRTRVKQYIGWTAPSLVNSGGFSKLLDGYGTKVACRSWGSGRC